jgi:hypothetical protein
LQWEVPPPASPWQKIGTAPEGSQSLDDDDNGEEQGDLLSMKDREGRDALQIAVEEGNVNFAAMLISHGALYAGDFLKNKYDAENLDRIREKWKPVTDAVIRAKQRNDPRQHRFLSTFFSGTLAYETDVNPLESDADVLTILNGQFGPLSQPTLEHAQVKNPAFAQLVRTLAFTRMPKYCQVAVEAKKGLSAYIKALQGASDDCVGPGDHDEISDGAPLVRAGSSGAVVHPFVLAVAAHIANSERDFDSAKHFLNELKKCRPSLSPCEQNLESALDRDCSVDESAIVTEMFGVHDSIGREYDQAVKGYDAAQVAPLDELMTYIGVRKVKELGLRMFSLGKDREMLRSEGKEQSMVEPMLNFTFCGNPGCGKTETARLIAKILMKSGIRRENYVEVTGQNAIKMGFKEFSKMLVEKQLIAGPKSGSPEAMPSDKFLKDEAVEVQRGSKFMKGRVVEVPGNKVQGTPNSSLYDVRLENGSSDSFEFKQMRRIRVVDSPSGGVLFIDEAYELNPAKDPEGKKIFEELLNISENCRTTLSVILGGYRKEIEEKLFDFNPGAILFCKFLACFMACHVSDLGILCLLCRNGRTL